MKFYSDLQFAEEAKKRLKPLYGEHSYEGRYVFINKGDKFKSFGSENIQKEMCVDTIIQKSDHESILVEEKFRRVDYGDLLVEDMSCTVEGREKKGWIHTSYADYLLYCVPNNELFIVRVLGMPPLRDFFIKNKDKYEFQHTQQINRTKFYMIPWEDIEFNYQEFKVI